MIKLVRETEVAGACFFCKGKLFSMLEQGGDSTIRSAEAKKAAKRLCH